MKKTKILALIMAAALALTACGGGSSTQGGGDSEEIKDLVTFETSNREMEKVFILNSEQASDLNVLTNCNDGLLSNDTKGQLIPSIAEEWGTEDGGLTWTFKLREGVKWVDVNGEVKADCTAQDWITGLEWVMNYHKNGTLNTSMPTSLIKGAG